MKKNVIVMTAWAFVKRWHKRIKKDILSVRLSATRKSENGGSSSLALSSARTTANTIYGAKILNNWEKIQSQV